MSQNKNLTARDFKFYLSPKSEKEHGKVGIDD